MEPLQIAKISQKLIEREQPEIVFLGKQSIDGDQSQTPQLLSALTGYPVASFASKVSVEDDKVQVVREIDGGLETVELGKPAIISADLRLNEPRFTNLRNIMAAKKKPIETLKISDLISEEEGKAHLKVKEYRLPAKRTAGIKVETTEELFDKLRNEAKVL